MNVVKAVDQDAFENYDTKQVRQNFLISDIFLPNEIKLTYSYYDRLIVGGICPEDKLALIVDQHQIGTTSLLERREMDIVNVGDSGTIAVDGESFELENKDCLYIGMGSRDIHFSSHHRRKPAKFYINCTTAHKAYPTTKIPHSASSPLQLGSSDKSNRRTIHKYIHPEGVESSQLVMGLTILEPNNMWNTMPTHTHDRRMEAYFYFNLPEDEVVFHLMGKANETRHIVVRNEEAVLSPSWSIHSGVGTFNYTFVWGMAGENQTFTDMDTVKMSALM